MDQPHTQSGELRYPMAVKLLAVVLTLFPVLLFASQAALGTGPVHPDVRLVMLILISGFLASGAPVAVELFRVRHTCDGEQLVYRTPWSKERSLRWAEATQLRWRPAFNVLEIQDSRGQRFFFQVLLGGLEALAVTAKQHLPPAVLETSRDGAAVLELMRRGRARGLMSSQDTPEVLLSKLPPEERSP